MSEKDFEISIVGGGASGALTATRILLSGFKGRLALITRDPELARGPAYCSRDRHHLLNVRAGKMSAFPEDPNHFVEWLSKMGLATEGLSERFVPRNLYGEYLFQTLTAAAAVSSAEFEVIHDEAIGLESLGKNFSIDLRSGSSILAHQVILALGNLPPNLPKPYDVHAANKRLVRNPWCPDGLDGVGKRDTVLIVGTGLTMVDVVLSLKAGGHEGRILARSRRGLTPQAHTSSAAQPKERPSTIAELIRGCRDAGGEWRGVLDSIRGETPTLWGSLCWEGRKRVLDRLMVFWDIHRHRMPESVASLIANQREIGILDIGAGTAKSVIEREDGFEVAFESETLTANWIVNCTGPSSYWASAKTPLLESAVAHGLLSYDPLGMGVVVDSDGRVGPTGRIWALGPICRGCRLETTAMPEIRVQAKALAEQIQAVDGAMTA